MITKDSPSHTQARERVQMSQMQRVPPVVAMVSPAKTHKTVKSTLQSGPSSDDEVVTPAGLLSQLLFSQKQAAKSHRKPLPIKMARRPKALIANPNLEVGSIAYDMKLMEI